MACFEFLSALDPARFGRRVSVAVFRWQQCVFGPGVALPSEVLARKPASYREEVLSFNLKLWRLLATVEPLSGQPTTQAA